MTDTARRVLCALADMHAQYDTAPSARDIARDLDLASPTSVRVQLAALHASGHVRQTLGGRFVPTEAGWHAAGWRHRVARVRRVGR